MQDQAQGDRRPRARPQRRARQPRPVRRGRRAARRHPQPPGGRGHAAWSRNTGVVFDALTERDGQLRSLIENSNTRVRRRPRRATSSSRRRSSRCRRSSASRAATLDRLAEFAQTTDPLVTQLRPAARELSPTLQDLGALAPDLKALFQRPRPADRRVADRLPGGRAAPRGRAAADRPARPDAAPAHPDPRLPRALQARAHRVLRQHRRRDAGQRLRAASTTCARRTRSTPRTSRSIRAGSAPTGRTRTPSRATSSSCSQGMPVFEDRHCGAGMPADHQRPAAAAAAGRRRPRCPTELLDNIIAVRVRRHRRQRRRRRRAAQQGPLQLRRRDHAVPARPRAMTPF